MWYAVGCLVFFRTRRFLRTFANKWNYKKLPLWKRTALLKLLCPTWVRPCLGLPGPVIFYLGPEEALASSSVCMAPDISNLKK